MNDDDNVIPLPPHGRPPRLENDPSMPCSWCDTPTARSTLNTFGARCYRCYRAYCEAYQPVPLLPAIGEKAMNPKAWAKTLQQREKNGERLSPVQRQMWRDALGFQTEAP